MTDADIRHCWRHGFDRVGPGDTGRGPACACHWASSVHGDTCPEHGAAGLPAPSPAEMLTWLREVEAANAELAAAMTGLLLYGRSQPGNYLQYAAADRAARAALAKHKEASQ